MAPALSLPLSSPSVTKISPSFSSLGPFATPGSPSSTDSSTTFTAFDAEGERIKLQEEAEAFSHAKFTLLSVIDGCQQLLQSLSSQSNRWDLAYPVMSGLSTRETQTETSSASAGAPMCASNATASEEPAGRDQAASGRPRYAPSTNQLTVLSVDPFGGKARSMSYLSALTGSALDRKAISTLLCSHVGSVHTHLEHLRTRMMDGSSRILVTGDLNAGKSTFVNALLRRNVTPMDQQPCTEVMCEIIDATINGNVEEIHALRPGSTYDISDHSTFTRFPVQDLPALVNVQSDTVDTDVSTHPVYELLKVYIVKQETTATLQRATSLLKQGDISVSFIDAPGLNRDTISTTMLFSKQSTIDVVVFVVSAENQFTLSAQEFLWAASQEKAYVFVVINKWSSISNKPKAQRRVFEQVRKLSPGTWDKRHELLHFVDSAGVLQITGKPSKSDDMDAFNHLERCLSSFVFRKRLASKLQPAHTFACNLLRDLLTISAINQDCAIHQQHEAALRLQNVLPEWEHLSASKMLVEEGICAIEEATVDEVANTAQDRLTFALQLTLNGKSSAPFPEYQGITRLWQYAAEVQRTLANGIDSEVKALEEFARQATIKAVTEIRSGLGSRVLPEHARQVDRTFRPEVMFARRKRNAASSHSQVSGLGIGMANAANIGYLDLFNFDQFFDFIHTVSKPVNDDGTLSVLGGVGMGSLALFGTGAASSKAFADSLLRVCEVLGSKGARRWAGLLASLAALGMGVFLITDLPNAIPRNVGRRLERTLNASGRWSHDESQRITKETRKVIRLAGWDLRERFRRALEAAETERNEAAALEESGMNAQLWFEKFKQEVEQLMVLSDDAKSSLDLQE